VDAFHGLLVGFQVALTPTNLFYCFAGCFLGTLIGVLPGIGPAAGIAILIPITSGLESTTALIMLAGIYYGAMYGGSTTAILISLPGEAGSVATVLDGYQMARKGRAGPALGISAISSFVAGTLSVIGLMLLAPPLASVALAFGPPEVFFVMVLGMTIVMSVSGESMIKGLMTGCFGLFIATVGLDSQTGAARFTFGNWKLAAGFDVISVVVGLFGISEILSTASKPEGQVFETKLGSLLPTLQELKSCVPTFGRCTLIGFLVGLLPGGNSAIASFMAYDVEKKMSKHPERFDDPRPPTGSASFRTESQLCLGPDRQHVRGQCDAAGSEPAAGRFLGQHAENPLSYAGPYCSGFLFHRSLYYPRQPF
jgi:putative tricarboxylic transport membrane protein